MRINTFFYSIRQGLKNIFRNKMFSLASMATMAACIFMFGLFYIIVTNFSATVHSIEEGVSVTVFFENDATDAQIRGIGEKINKRAEVSKNEYVSADEAWKEYKKVYFQGKEELADGFTDNPLANSAHYQVYLNDVSMQDSLVTYIKGLTGVREVKESAQVANTLTDFNKLLGYVSGGIILILLCVAVFLISNTVTVGISVRKEEIAIMKLIGATDFLVRAPFIVEGIVGNADYDKAIDSVIPHVFQEKDAHTVLGGDYAGSGNLQEVMQFMHNVPTAAKKEFYIVKTLSVEKETIARNFENSAASQGVVLRIGSLRFFLKQS